MYLYGLYLGIQPTILFQDSCLYEETAWESEQLYESAPLIQHTKLFSISAAYIGMHAFPFKRLTYRYQLLLIIIFTLLTLLDTASYSN